ncbi:(2,3-dihydroxybenzoyl)adenylate synthase [Pelistega sp. NLN82]|uniref:(2,3-dihydroxybenzoyl)adenylate synthase n=1 Tax=Pelistega ratti TaxID=2652177 RepID=A0A6L9Y5W3_9BURK|nr:(2,3-dihydroxybenzoyl)adenylate synthase [Pelistega ratti]NEN75317.1 (2,3-dihydroxybenzoyl)adenylate synthase [Pelistega ratti]
MKPFVVFTKWPEERAKFYRQKKYWLDIPLCAILDKQVSNNPDATAIICGDRCFSYKQLSIYATNLAINLKNYGLQHGDTALVQLPNVAEFYIVLFALLKLGVVPLNALYSHRQYELHSFIQQINPKLVIVSSEHEVFRNEVINKNIKLLGIESSSLILKLSEKNNASTALTQDNLWYWLESDKTEEIIPTPPDEVALFQLSGGSTSIPKLIPRTHNDYYYSIRTSAEICQLNTKTKFLCALPLPHNYILSSPGALGVFHKGGCIVLAASPEPLHCFELIEKHKVNMAALVPSAVITWLEQAITYPIQKISSLKLLQVGGANFSSSLAKKVPLLLKCKLQQVFGMAEGLVNYTRLDDSEDTIFTTQGRPLSPDDEIKIINELGEQIIGEGIGILATRGPYTFCGYYNSPEQNQKVFDSDGFYYTGDLVQRTPSGNIRVVGRVKDQINRGGEKIASEELENLILLHPDITQVAIVAKPDMNYGEKTVAFIISKNNQLKPFQLKKFLLEKGIAEYKLPDFIYFIESMPLTAVGKIDKNELRKMLTT